MLLSPGRLRICALFDILVENVTFFRIAGGHDWPQFSPSEGEEWRIGRERERRQGWEVDGSA